MAVSKRTLYVTGSLRDATGKPVQSMPVKINVNGAYYVTVVTNSAGNYLYNGAGPSVTGQYTVTVVFEGTSNYGPSQASQTQYI